MEHTDLLSLNVTSHFNRMGRKNRRMSFKKTVQNEKKEMFKESFSELCLNALISLIFHEHVCATTATYRTCSGAQLYNTYDIHICIYMHIHTYSLLKKYAASD